MSFHISVAPANDSNIFEKCSIIVACGLHSRWVHPKSSWSRNDVGSSMSTFFIEFFHMGAILFFFPAILMSSTYTDRNNPCFRWTNMHSQFGIFSHPSSDKASSNCLSHNNPGQWMTVQVSFNKYHGIFNYCPWFWPFMPWKTYPNVWSFRSGNFEQSGSILQFYLRRKAGTASAACPPQPGNLAITSITFAAIWNADEPCSVKTAWAPEPSFTMPLPEHDSASILL